MTNLANFENAYRLALVMSECCRADHVVIRTANAAQPFKVEAAAGQPDAIAVCSTAEDPAYPSSELEAC
jgi:hypothetical protein